MLAPQQLFRHGPIAGDHRDRFKPPAAIATHEVELAGGFFAPDGLHGWIVGTDHTSNTGLGITTADGGATWSMVSGLGTSKLYTGFALDATHVWIGGDEGVLLTNH